MLIREAEVVGYEGRRRFIHQRPVGREHDMMTNIVIGVQRRLTYYQL